MGCCLEKFYGNDTEIKKQHIGKPEIRLVSSEDDTTIGKTITQCEEPVPTRVIALYDYEPRDAGDIGFKQWDEFTVISNENPFWWLVKRIETGDEGYVPGNYIRPTGTLGSEKWFFGSITRKDSEKLLLKSGKKGRFLIRESETSQNFYSLSLLNEDDTQGKYVKHYRIRYNENGAYYITEGLEFDQLSSLINYYHDDAHVLCCQLIEPCSIREKPQTLSLAPDTTDIQDDRLQLMDEIEKYENSVSHKAVWNDRVVILVKKYNSQPSSSNLAAMRQLHHKSILKYFGSIPSQPTSLCWEYFTEGNLSDFLKRSSELSVSDFIDIALQIATGMAYLESSGFSHKYLRARHVAVCSESVFKVADYGVYETPVDVDADAFLWLSPEAIKEQMYDIKADVWSFGILATEIVSKGERPYSNEGLSQNDLLEKLASNYRMPRHNQCPVALYEFLLQCWDKDADLRPTFEYIQIFLESFFQRTNQADSI